MSAWESVTWDVARAGGFTAYALLALAVAVGLALTLRMQSPRWPRIINAELHNFLSLLALVFTGIHVAAVWVDPFTRFSWSEVFIPFVSHYRSLWMGLGIVGLYLGLAIGLSTWLRPLIGYAWWRRLHVLTLVLYALVTVHGVATGSDTRTWWGLLIYATSITVVGTLVAVRLLAPGDAQARAHPVFAALTALALLVGIGWATHGPLQAGWNAAANDGRGSGARDVLAAAVDSSQSASASTAGSGAAATSPAPFATPFTASLQGTLAQTGPDGSGVVTLRLDTALSGGAQGVLTIALQGQSDGGAEDGGVQFTQTSVTLGASSSTALYRGQLTQLETGGRWRMTALLRGSGSSAGQIELRIRAAVDSSGNVTGTVAGAPVTTSPGSSSSSSSGDGI